MQTRSQLTKAFTILSFIEGISLLLLFFIGKIQNLENVDWSIPQESKLTKEFLARCKKAAAEALRVFFGAPAWGHSSWLGKIYPPGTKRTDYLSYYSRYFNCIELNTSHYRIPSREQIRSWLSQVPEDFLFCPKIYQGISHARHGLLDRRLLQEWLDSIQQMGRHLGPMSLCSPSNCAILRGLRTVRFCRL